MYSEKQAIIAHDPQKGIYGDCFRTCLAALLQVPRDEVPHFMDSGRPAEQVWPIVDEWLGHRGLRLWHVGYGITELEQLFHHMKVVNPGVTYLLGGNSKRGFPHQVIACEDKIVYDPHPDNDGVVGPCSDGIFWVEVLIPTQFHVLSPSFSAVMKMFNEYYEQAKMGDEFAIEILPGLAKQLLDVAKGNMTKDSIVQLFKIMGFRNIRSLDGWIKCSCPFSAFPGYHNGTDRHPSFGASAENPSHYHCFSCHMKGLLVALPTTLAFMGARDNPQARAFALAHESWTDDNYEQEEIIEPSPIFNWALNDFQKASENIYKTRGITKAMAEFYDLRWDQWRKRLLFIIKDSDGQVVGIRGRLMEGMSDLKYLSYTELHPKELDPKRMGVWYGMEHEPKRDKLLPLTEGEINKIILHQSGLTTNIPWAAMGSSVSRAQMRTLKGVRSPLLVLFDDDPAGKSATVKIVEEMKDLVPVYGIRNYFGCNDVAEMYQKKVLQQALRTIKKL